MATADDVAAYILRKRRAVNSVRLQKLLYYSQAWHLVAMGSPLFENEVMAFEYGPVVYDVWDKHRYVNTLKWSDATGDPDALTDLEQEVVDAVLEAYKRHHPFELAKLSHDEAPWANAYYQPRGDRKITHAAMRDYYAQEVVKAPKHRTTPVIPHIPDARITYLREDELADLVDSIDEPDPADGLIEALRRSRDS